VVPGRHAGPAIPIATGPTPGRSRTRRAKPTLIGCRGTCVRQPSRQATCTLLELVGQFGASGALRYWVGLKSVTHWWSWTCSMVPASPTVDLRARLPRGGAVVLVAAVQAAKDQFSQAGPGAKPGAEAKTGGGARSMGRRAIQRSRLRPGSLLHTDPDPRAKPGPRRGRKLVLLRSG
jgi:hypothetical protein